MNVSQSISCVVYEERKCSRFCRDADWNGAFNFSNNLDFVTNCVKQIKGSIFHFVLYLFIVHLIAPKDGLECQIHMIACYRGKTAEFFISNYSMKINERITPLISAT